MSRTGWLWWPGRPPLPCPRSARCAPIPRGAERDEGEYQTAPTRHEPCRSRRRPRRSTGRPPGLPLTLRPANVDSARGARRPAQADPRTGRRAPVERCSPGSSRANAPTRRPGGPCRARGLPRTPGAGAWILVRRPAPRRARCSGQCRIGLVAAPRCRLGDRPVRAGGCRRGVRAALRRRALRRASSAATGGRTLRRPRLHAVDFHAGTRDRTRPVHIEEAAARGRAACGGVVRDHRRTRWRGCAIRGIVARRPCGLDPVRAVLAARPGVPAARAGTPGRAGRAPRGRARAAGARPSARATATSSR